MNESEYGPLADLVKYSGMLMSAALAIGLAWRRRANWEPCEEDVPKGPSRVAGLLSAIAIEGENRIYECASERQRWRRPRARKSIGYHRDSIDVIRGERQVYRVAEVLVEDLA